MKALLTFEYTGQDVTIIIQAKDKDSAFDFLKKKLSDEDCREIVLYDELMDITSNGVGVIAFVDQRSAF